MAGGIPFLENANLAACSRRHGVIHTQVLQLKERLEDSYYRFGSPIAHGFNPDFVTDYTRWRHRLHVDNLEPCTCVIDLHVYNADRTHASPIARG